MPNVRVLAIGSLLLAAYLGPLPAEAASGGGGGGGGGPGIGSFGQTRGQEAVALYQSAEKHLARAARYEREAAEADTEKERTKLEDRAGSRYRRAAKDLRKAVRKRKDLFQAWGMLGFALRSGGDYEAALEAYDRALEIEPRYAEAVEYRAEAYLELGRLKEAKAAYMQLFGPVRPLADQLMERMEAWVARHREDPAGLDPSVIEDFAGWVEGRGEVAQQAAVGGAPSARW